MTSCLHRSRRERCGTNLTEIENIKEILVPQMMGGTSSEFVASVSFGNPVDAFFCDASNNQVPDPVLEATLFKCVYD
jgi:hypothetical protein